MVQEKAGSWNIIPILSIREPGFIEDQTVLGNILFTAFEDGPSSDAPNGESAQNGLVFGKSRFPYWHPWNDIPEFGFFLNYGVRASP